MSERDYTLVQERGNRLRLHRPDCALVDEARRNGNPMITMFECRGEPDKTILRCACLDEPK